ncbi:hypothetical protein [Acinetobacter wuhouensis]|uniref:Lipoprotein n=1 Tax=Acinetobacter wuhouensis TaxID=1879050 RepID=A0A3G2T3K9_9GAMM|nr:hypothetical protein [Acinetobacter wuhouensis]AYO54853.1 hypothetical protein CDG68_14860 [Acinetobacter wuhouensis]
MKIKALSFTILSSLLFTACGGGGSDSSTSSHGSIKDESEWYMYETGYSIEDQNLFSKLKFSFQDNQAFLNVEYTADGSNKYELDDLLSTYLASDGLYFPATTKTNLGYPFGTFSAKSATNWTYTPYSNEGQRTALKLTEKFEAVNLSGKPMSQYINGFDHFAGLDPVLSISAEKYSAYYVQKLKDKTFPSGSICLRSQTSSSNTDYAEVDTSSSIENFDPKNYFDFGYTIKNINNFQLYVSKDIEPNTSIESVLKLGSIYIYADYFNKGVYYSLATDIKQHEQYYDEVVSESGKDSSRAHYYKALLNGLKSECTLFNKTASIAIDAVR